MRLLRRAKRLCGIRNWAVDFSGVKSNSKVVYKLKRTGLFQQAEEVRVLCEEYLDSCWTPKVYKGRAVTGVDGKIVKEQTSPYTVAGLARYLGMSTDTFHKYCSGVMDNYEDEGETISSVLNYYKQAIEVYAEERLYDKEGFNGARFVLDHYFKKLSTKEMYEIHQIQKQLEFKERELRIKEELMDVGGSEDTDIQVTILRKSKEDV